jgi:hypothetical protein
MGRPILITRDSFQFISGKFQWPQLPLPRMIEKKHSAVSSVRYANRPENSKVGLLSGLSRILKTAYVHSVQLMKGFTVRKPTKLDGRNVNDIINPH